MAFIDIESEIAINENGEEVTIEGTSNSARLTFYLGDGNITNISLPETYMVNSISTQNGSEISGDPGASVEYNFSIRITVPANDETIIKTREIVVEDEIGNKGVCVLSLAAQKKTYTEVEYIESTGTQWIRTGIFPDDNTIKCEVKIAYSSTSTGQLMGSGTSGSARFNFGIESRKFRFGFGGSWFDANSEVTTPDTNPHVFILDASTKTGYVDGVPQTTTNNYIATGSHVFMLFARGASNSAENGNRTKGKLYYVKLWNKGELVRDLIPVLDEEGIACMYDNVSGEFFYNSGTGQFVAGDIV